MACATRGFGRVSAPAPDDRPLRTFAHKYLCCSDTHKKVAAMAGGGKVPDKVF
jgi:hypothetical protein